MLRIYSTRLYIASEHPGISGFVRHWETEHRLIRGESVKARGLRGQVVPYCPVEYRHAMFRLEDGHLPEFQPIVTSDAAAEVVANTPGMTAVLVEGGPQ